MQKKINYNIVSRMESFTICRDIHSHYQKRWKYCIFSGWKLSDTRPILPVCATDMYRATPEFNIDALVCLVKWVFRVGPCAGKMGCVQKMWPMSIFVQQAQFRWLIHVAASIIEGGNTVASVRLSVCPSVRPTVRLFPLYLRNRLTVDLELLRVSR